MEKAKFEKKESFESVYTSNRWKVINRIRIALRCNQQLAEDLSCKVFIKANKYYESFNPELSSFNTWLNMITTQVMIDYKRSKEGKRKYQTEFINDKVNSDGEVYFQVKGSRDMQTDVNLELSELETLVQKTISSFNEVHQKVCKLQIDGLQMQEIAKELEIPEGTVKVYIFRFRNLLKSKLEKQNS